MIAAMMAGITAVETFMVVGSGLFTRNFYERIYPGRPEAHYLWVGRLAALGMLVAGILIALFAPSVTAILKPSLEIIAFVGIPMWLGIFWRRATTEGAWASIVVGLLAWGWGFHQGWDTQYRALLFVPAGFLAGFLVSLITPRLPDEQLDRFYARLHTPISPAEVEEGRDAQPVEPTQPPLTHKFGLEIPRPTRTDIGGFLLAWGLVGFLIALLWFLARIGA
jgi:Na+/proline symporter